LFDEVNHKWALLKIKWLMLKYSASQPRIPAGSADGGRWTSEGGSGGINDPRILSDVTPDNLFKPGAQLAQNDNQGHYNVNLSDEEARGGHTQREHVAKSDSELLETLRQRRFDFLFMSVVGKREGSFGSSESANDFVNRTLEQNKVAVDLVATGKLNREFITARFGYITGREAYRSSADTEPYVRDTYGVGVEIRHDPRIGRGYRVLTAYPRND
jgi:hypothetical protein